MKKTWSFVFLVLVVAQAVLLFMPWLTLHNDVHQYTITDIMEIQDWWRGRGANFGFAFFCMWTAIVSICATMLLQLLACVSIFQGKPLHHGRSKALVVTSLIAVIFAGLLYVAFYFGIDTAFPTVYMAILPVSLIFNLVFLRRRNYADT